MKKRESDYSFYFILGPVFFAIGIATKIYGLLAVGVAFIALGLAGNKKKVKKKRR